MYKDITHDAGSVDPAYRSMQATCPHEAALLLLRIEQLNRL